MFSVQRIVNYIEIAWIYWDTCKHLHVLFWGFDVFLSWYYFVWLYNKRYKRWTTYMCSWFFFKLRRATQVLSLLASYHSFRTPFNRLLLSSTFRPPCTTNVRSRPFTVGPQTCLNLGQIQGVYTDRKKKKKKYPTK